MVIFVTASTTPFANFSRGALAVDPAGAVARCRRADVGILSSAAGGGPGNAWPNGRNSGIEPQSFQPAFADEFLKESSQSVLEEVRRLGQWERSRASPVWMGLGSWLDPWCSWPWYEAIPVADYANAYTDCAGVMIDGIDYSVPISQMPADTLTGPDSELYAAARGAFLRGDFDTALSAISQAIVQMPHNRDLHQFHSLVLFARNDYCRSATVAYAVLEDGPGWTWDICKRFIPCPTSTRVSFAIFEHYVSANPSEANVRFLLGYHYLMLDHTDVARRQLTQVVELRPADKLSARILTGIGEAPTTTPVAVDNNGQTTAKRVVTNPPVTDPIDAGRRLSTRPALRSPVRGRPIPRKRFTSNWLFVTTGGSNGSSRRTADRKNSAGNTT